MATSGEATLSITQPSALHNKLAVSSALRRKSSVSQRMFVNSQNFSSNEGLAKKYAPANQTQA